MYAAYYPRLVTRRAERRGSWSRRRYKYNQSTEFEDFVALSGQVSARAFPRARNGSRYAPAGSAACVVSILDPLAFSRTPIINDGTAERRASDLASYPR